MREALLSKLAVGILKTLFMTLRVRIQDASGMLDGTHPGPCILVFWHNRILAITRAFAKFYPRTGRRGVTVLTSASRDGEILARIVAGFGMGAARGSSSRRGARALRELARLVDEGRDIAITPDGPRGPRYALGPGAVQLAGMTGAPLVMVHAEFSWAITMKTWDGFRVPLPFSSVRIRVDAPTRIPPDLDPGAFEAWRRRIEDHLTSQLHD